MLLIFFLTYQHAEEDYDHDMRDYTGSDTHLNGSRVPRLLNRLQREYLKKFILIEDIYIIKFLELI